jgi:hypothetical protein
MGLATKARPILKVEQQQGVDSVLCVHQQRHVAWDEKTWQ